MKLKAWREREGKSLKDVADALDINDIATVFRWEQEPGVSSRRIPTEGYMRRLYRVTRGAVTPNDFYDLPDLDAPELPLDPEPLPLFEGGADDAPAPFFLEPERQAA